jgi:hypothetical protein
MSFLSVKYNLVIVFELLCILSRGPSLAAIPRKRRGAYLCATSAVMHRCFKEYKKFESLK